MAPPPKPPVICYDLYSDMAQTRPRRCTLDTRAQIHRTSYLSGVTRRHQPPPLVLERSPPLAAVRSSYQNTTYATNKATPTTTPFYVKCVKENGYNNNIKNKNTQHHYDSNQLRHEYGDKLRREQDEKARLKAERLLHQSMKEQIERLTDKLDSVKRAQDHMSKQYGMGHNTAKYMQDKEEEIAELKREIEQCRELRRLEAEKHTEQMKQLMLERQRSAEKRSLRNLTNQHMTPTCKRSMASALMCSTPHRDTPNSLSSPSNSNSTSNNSSQNDMTNSQRSSQSSSTISISSSPSSSVHSSLEDHAATTATTPQTRRNQTRIKSAVTFTPRSCHLVKTPQLNTGRSNRHVTINTTPFKTPPTHTTFTPPSMFFHTAPMDEDTLEVTDTNFFDMVEDKTMMEVQSLLHRMESTLKKVKNL